jgi:hypothetical protein
MPSLLQVLVIKSTLLLFIVRAMALAVSRRPLRLGLEPGSVYLRYVVGKMVLGQDFSDFFDYSLSVAFHRGSPYSYVTPGE